MNSVVMSSGAVGSGGSVASARPPNVATARPTAAAMIPMRIAIDARPVCATEVRDLLSLTLKDPRPGDRQMLDVCNDV